MKRLLIYLFAGLMVVSASQAAQWNKMASSQPQIVQSGKTRMWCSICGNLNENQLQAVGLYLWDVKRTHAHHHGAKKGVDVPEDAKCPVCGMFVAKYPRWSTRVADGQGRACYFDGAKDMFKFYLEPKKWGRKIGAIKQVEVNDYYSQVAIDGTKAFYVIGSDVHGPMGNELIPFEKMENAKVFKEDHGGSKILRFEEVAKGQVYSLDQ